MTRPDKQTYFMSIADSVAKRGTCNRAVVGAVLVRDGLIIATGYNGAPHGMDHCDDIGHLIVDGHCVRAVHAEVNALLHMNSMTAHGATCYTTHYPCRYCLMCLVNARVSKIVYRRLYGELHRGFDMVDVVKCSEQLDIDKVVKNNDGYGAL